MARPYSGPEAITPGTLLLQAPQHESPGLPPGAPAHRRLFRSRAPHRQGSAGTLQLVKGRPRFSCSKDRPATIGAGYVSGAGLDTAREAALICSRFRLTGSTDPADNSRFDSQPGLPSSSEFCAGLSRPSRLVPREGLAKAASTFAASSCSRLPGLSCLNPENIRMTHRLRERAIRAAVPTLRFRRNPTGSSGNFAGLSRLSGSACRRGLQRLATAVGGNRPRCYGHHQSLETVGGEPHQPNPQCCALSRPG